jgi:hypothetical protein
VTWFNISYNDASVRAKVDAICGKPLPFWKTLRMGGTGSPRLILNDGPAALLALIDRAEDRRFAQIEIRANGLLVRVRQRLETIGIPLSWAMVHEMVLTPTSVAADPGLHVVMKSGAGLVFAVHTSLWGALRDWHAKAERSR